MNYWYMYGISVLPETYNEPLVCAVYLFYLEHTMN